MSPRQIRASSSLAGPPRGTVAAESLRRQRRFYAAAFGWWLEKAAPAAEEVAAEIAGVAEDLRLRVEEAKRRDGR